ncbi:PhzF family phenazine biosynthesis protein [Streptomyces sp. NPDC048172]|uniref:PhzF family phenazine biosynthesis protein n=1 Tax=Streptomyces sp. NPDC048172 TaxID=3365505 RepID=UPI0037185140
MRIRTVDAFAVRPYTGNPAAVVLFDSGPFPEDGRLQTLAAEMNLAETAFAHPLPDDPEADWALRWFTPVNEVDLCGHATVATAHVLSEDGHAKPGEPVRFRTRSGVLSATARPCGDIALDFPTSEPTPVEVPAALAAALTAALGTEATAAYDTAPMDFLLVELADEAAVRGLTPDLTAVAALDWPALIVTARAAGASSADGGAYDFVSRVFAPRQGIPEDPVTGSAHTALAPLWSARLGSDRLTGLQASARSGYVRTELRGERTLLTGSAVTVLDAELRTEL